MRKAIFAGFVSVWTLFGAVAFPTPAWAVPITGTFDFSATAFTPFQLGLTITGDVTLTHDPSGPNEFGGEIEDINLSILGHEYVIGGTATQLAMSFDRIDFLAGGDYFLVIYSGVSAIGCAPSPCNDVRLTIIPSVPVLTGFSFRFTPPPGGFGVGQGLVGASSVTFTESTEMPEPSTLALFATGLAGLGFMGWRRKRHGASLTLARVHGIILAYSLCGEILSRRDGDV